MSRAPTKCDPFQGCVAIAKRWAGVNAVTPHEILYATVVQTWYTPTCTGMPEHHHVASIIMCVCLVEEGGHGIILGEL